MKKIKLQLSRFVFKLFVKLSKPTTMSNSINSIIQNKIIPCLSIGYSVVDFKVLINSPQKITYELTFNDGKTLTFGISFDGVSVYFEFIESNIVHLEIVGETIVKLSNALKSNHELIKCHFFTFNS